MKTIDKINLIMVGSNIVSAAVHLDRENYLFAALLLVLAIVLFLTSWDADKN